MRGACECPRNPAGERFLSRDGIDFDLRHAAGLVGHSARHFTTVSLLGDYDEKELGYVQFVCDLYHH